MGDDMSADKTNLAILARFIERLGAIRDTDCHTELVDWKEANRAVKELVAEQADRAGGDGRRQTIEKCIKIVALEMYPDPVTTEDFYHNRKCQTAIDGLNAVLDAIRAAAQGLCETTLTERFVNPDCRCNTYAGNLGPCKTFEVGQSGRCVYCDHEASCHLAAPPQPAPDTEPDCGYPAKVAELTAALDETTRQCQHWKRLAKASQPAPNAMREAHGAVAVTTRPRRDDPVTIDNNKTAQLKVGHFWDAQAALSSAPVPSGEGSDVRVGGAL
jgi:hypothetical protein